VKFAFITLTSTIPFGSCDLLNYRTAIAARKAGHEVLLSFNDFGEKESPKYKELEALGIQLDRREMYSADSLISRLKFKLQYRLLDKARTFRALFAFKPDYIFINNQGTYDFVMNPLGTLIDETKIPYAILSQHNHEINQLPATFYKLARSIFKKAHKIFYISHRNLETSRRNLALPLPQAVEVCNPLSSDTVEYVPYPTSETPMMCMVARFECDVKAQDIVLSVLGNEQWRTRDWVLNLYGEGPDKQMLEDLVSFYGLEKKVNFCGYKNRIEDIWAANQLLIMSSVSEGTPISLLTATVGGRASVVTNVGGNAEYVVDNETGFVAEAPTYNCLNDALNRAWQRRGEWEEIGRRSRAFAQQKIDFKPEETILKHITSA
jgi:L-malate glycosyltransferase